MTASPDSRRLKLSHTGNDRISPPTSSCWPSRYDGCDFGSRRRSPNEFQITTRERDCCSMLSSTSRAIVMSRRSRRYSTLLIAVVLLASAGIAGATSWVVILANASHPAQSQSTSVNAPTAGAAANPTSTHLSLSWVKPVSGATPTGYLVTRNGSAVPSGGCAGTVAATSCLDSGLTANTPYTYSVKAHIGTNWTSVASSTFSNTTNATFVITGITSTNASGNTVGRMGIGDTFAVTFNYAVNPTTVTTGAGASTMTLVGGSSSTTISINTLTSSGFAVTSNYENSGNTSAATGTLSLSNANKTVTFTVTGSPSNATQLATGAASTFTFVPLASIQDVSGDTASTSFSQSPELQIF